MIAGLQDASGERGRSLERLAAHYFYPVFAQLRDAGFAEADAYSFAHGFFNGLIAGLGEGTLPDRFRVYLLAQLDQFCADPAPAERPIPGAPALESVRKRYARDSDLPGPPAQVFDARFAREVMTRALLRLKTEAVGNGREALFLALAPYLIRDPQTSDRQRLKAELGLSGVALTIALRRLRARYAELGNAELTQTLCEPDDLASERTVINALFDPPQ